jgi:hypothetical protein
MYVDELLELYKRGPLQPAANRDNDGQHETSPHTAGA